MKKLIFSLIATSLAFTSCKSDEAAANNNSDTSIETAAVNTSKFEELAIEPCNLLTEEMITSRFGVSSDQLKLSDYSSKKGKISWTAYCTYSWKKPNFDEIQERTQAKMLEAMKDGDSKNVMSLVKDFEKPNFEVGLTNMKIYDDNEKAMKSFIQSHTVPEKKDLEQLNKAIDTESTDKITDQGKEVGKDMVDGIASNLKFDKIEGIGSSAYWDHLGSKLDVLYGTVQIGIIMHISENHDENVAAAKALAQEIMAQF